MSYGGFERRMNPDTMNESLVERDLFGDVVMESDATKQQAAAYRGELERRFPDLVRQTMSEKERAALLQRGYRMVEGLWSKEQSKEPPKPLLRDIRLRVRRALELPAKREDDLLIYSSVGHPLQEIAGIDGFLRINARPGRQPVYVSLGYEVDPHSAKDIADVDMSHIPDAESEPEEYGRALNGISDRIYQEYRRQKETQERGMPKRRF
ncbi:MAG: hypothetical protein A3A44_03555 [Candidatus Sungbacteria bacterium RIFCSPLOWO2_01_FULL_60_25]|uniref:Uncharacterized protein n=1 Tax=Candidatus Sungbacteria bacterium RIFCSPLOWO2_01_FULL_60_25 TaxID=1802281 RepID=A0A1G2LCB5_9BACT|nr:MAG: hypothetical protein A3A44_03555 [Candidatus Sungbacteria bacterium RIFCSPLOWO2_01_FULL_60_25]